MSAENKEATPANEAPKGFIFLATEIDGVKSTLPLFFQKNGTHEGKPWFRFANTEHKIEAYVGPKSTTIQNWRGNEPDGPTTVVAKLYTKANGETGELFLSGYAAQAIANGERDGKAQFKLGGELTHDEEGKVTNEGMAKLTGSIAGAIAQELKAIMEPVKHKKAAAPKP